MSSKISQVQTLKENFHFQSQFPKADQEANLRFTEIKIHREIIPQQKIITEQDRIFPQVIDQL